MSSKPQYRYRLGWRSLRHVVPSLSPTRAKALSVELGEAMHKFNITTSKRARMFIAQVAHESGGFIYREELASGAAYEGRRDLGNTHPGDGRRYKGRSYIQITGRANYADISKALGVDFVRSPGRLSEPKYAALAAAWWWSHNGLNQIADTGNFVASTKRVNGGFNGLSDRQAYYRRTLRVAPFLVPKRRKP